MFFIHSSYVEAKIGSFDNLKSIALDDECVFRYSYNAGKLTEFFFEFELTNYSSERRDFKIVMEIPSMDSNLRFTTESDNTYSQPAMKPRFFGLIFIRIQLF